MKTRQFRFLSLATLIVILMSSSCATKVHESSIITVSLKPVHKTNFQVFRSKDDTRNISFVGNDGNLYTTQWNVPEAKNNHFNYIETSCTKTTDSWYFSGWPVFIDQLDEKNIWPSNYKKVIACVETEGYELTSSHGFSPYAYKVDINRGRSVRGGLCARGWKNHN
jgi:hypothetical protein